MTLTKNLKESETVIKTVISGQMGEDHIMSRSQYGFYKGICLQIICMEFLEGVFEDVGILISKTHFTVIVAKVVVRKQI